MPVYPRDFVTCAALPPLLYVSWDLDGLSVDVESTRRTYTLMASRQHVLLAVVMWLQGLVQDGPWSPLWFEEWQLAVKKTVSSTVFRDTRDACRLHAIQRFLADFGDVESMAI